MKGGGVFLLFNLEQIYSNSWLECLLQGWDAIILNTNRVKNKIIDKCEVWY